MKYPTRREALGKSLQLGAAVALPLVESGIKAGSVAADRKLTIEPTPCWFLTRRCAAAEKFALYYFEVMTGDQSSNFCPTHYVDIAQTEARKRAACFAHASQNPGISTVSTTRGIAFEDSNVGANMLRLPSTRCRARTCHC